MFEGMTRAALNSSESNDFSIGAGPKRPRDAATLILLDRKGNDVLVLMGRRHHRHAFMPGKFVFPGGRTDPADSRVPVAAGLPEVEAARLIAGTRAAATRAQAIALSALRETYEEAGLLIGRKESFSTDKSSWQAFAEHGVRPSLEGVRFVARAITPPGRIRRFDTRFLSAWRDEVAVALPDGGPTGELEELVWLPIVDAHELDLPRITKTILKELQMRLDQDPELRPGGPVPFYRLKHSRVVRDIL